MCCGHFLGKQLPQLCNRMHKIASERAFSKMMEGMILKIVCSELCSERTLPPIDSRMPVTALDLLELS